VKNSIKILAVIFSVALNIAFLATYGVRKLSERPKFAYEELNLSKEQRQHFEDARDRFLRSINDTGDRIIGRQMELIDLVAADPLDRQAIEAKFDQVHDLQRSMQQQVAEHLLEDKQGMTREQQAKFFAILKSRIREQGAPGPPWLPTGARRRK
jgi:Spy/CpxP family protein refolding chaperone